MAKIAELVYRNEGDTQYQFHNLLDIGKENIKIILTNYSPRDLGRIYKELIKHGVIAYNKPDELKKKEKKKKSFGERILERMRRGTF